MKRFVILAVLGTAAVARGELPQAPPLPQAPKIEPPTDLDPSMASVPNLPDPKLYPPVPLAKLAAKDGWVRPRALVHGRVTLAKKEDDGDYHFRLEDEAGNFVVLEIIPELPLSEHPKVGMVIKAWGVARWDGEHKWGELHPLVDWVPVGASPGPKSAPAAWHSYPTDPGRVYLLRDGLTAGAYDFAAGVYASYDGQEWHFNAPLPGDPVLRAELHRLDKERPKEAVMRAVVPNQGHCPCGDGKCFCLPASKCSQGKCPKPAAKPLSALVPSFGACRT